MFNIHLKEHINIWVFLVKQALRAGGGEAAPQHGHVNTQPWVGLLTANKVLPAPQITPEDVPAASGKAEKAP